MAQILKKNKSFSVHVIVKQQMAVNVHKFKRKVRLESFDLDPIIRDNGISNARDSSGSF